MKTATIFPTRAMVHGTGRCLVAVLCLCLAACACLAGEPEDRLNFATGLLIKNEFELAAEEFETLLREHPDVAGADLALYRLGEARYKLGRRKQAVEAYARVVREHPDSDKLPQSCYRLGQLVSDEDHLEAARHYATVAQRWPENELAEPAAYWSAEERFQAGDYEGAAGAYRQVLADYPAGKYVAEALYSLGWAEYERGKDAEAEQILASFLQKFAGHRLAGGAGLKRAEALHRLKRMDDALALYRLLEKNGGANADEARVGIARCLYDAGRLAEAAVAFRKAADSLADSERAPVCLFNAGNALMESGDPGGAAAGFALLLQKHPAHRLAPEAGYWQGYALLRQGRFREAATVLESVRAAGKSGDREPDVLYALGEARFGLEEYAAADEVYRQVVQRFGAHTTAARAAYGRMLALEKTGDLEAAVTAGEEFLRVYGDSAVAHLARFALGEFRFRQGDYKRAADDFTAFQKAGKPGDLGDDAEYKLAWCAFHAGDNAGAGKRFLDVATAYADSPLAAESLYMAGRAADAAGDPDLAAKRYGECARKCAGSEHAHRSELSLMVLDLAGDRPQDALARATALLTQGVGGELADYAWLYKGEAQASLERYAEAEAAYAQVGKATAPAARDAGYGMAWVLRKQGKHVEASESFFAAARADSHKNEEAQFWGCRSLEDAGRFVEAAQAYGAFTNRLAGTARGDEAVYRRGLCLVQADKRDQAEELWTSFLRTRGGSDFADNALYELAWSALQRRDPQTASDRFEELERLFPGSELAGDVAFRRGELAYERGDYTAAATSYEAALRDANLAFADKVLYRLAWCCDRLDRAEDGILTFSRIAAEFPQSELREEALYRAGLMRKKQGKPDQALTFFLQVKQGPFRPKALLQAAECRRETQAFEDALATYDALLKEFPGTELTTRVHLGRGHCFRAVGASKDAEEAYGLVVAATDAPEAAAALLGMGYLHVARKQWKEAAKAFLKVDIVYGYEEFKPEALFMLAKTWENADEKEKAGRYREELKRRYPDSKFVKE